jgi:hypothetical protein
MSSELSELCRASSGWTRKKNYKVPQATGAVALSGDPSGEAHDQRRLQILKTQLRMALVRWQTKSTASQYASALLDGFTLPSGN